VVRIERQEHEDGRILSRIVYQRNRRVQALEFERVVLAVPFWRLHQIEMVPPLSDEKWQAVMSLGRGQYTVVHMIMPKAARSLWLQGGRTPFALLTDGALGVVYGVPSEAPESSPTEAFSLLVHGQAAAAFHMVPRELRLREIHAELDKKWPGFASQIAASYVYTYHPGAIPVWPPGRSPLDDSAEKLRQPELGLYLAGDYLYNAHSDGAARSGMHAAERLAAELPPAKSPKF
jgi:monoamine oxidase